MASTSILLVILNFNFWLDLILIFFVYKSKFNIMYAVLFIYSNLSPHCFPFSFFQGKFYLSPRKMVFFTVIAVNDWIFNRIYRFSHRPRVWQLVWIAVTIRNSIPNLHIFIIWRIAGWQRFIRRPPWIRMWNGPPFIIDLLSPGGRSRGGEFHKCSDIYTPPPLKTTPYRGMLKRYFPSWTTPQVIPDGGAGVWGLSLNCVR